MNSSCITFFAVCMEVFMFHRVTQASAYHNVIKRVAVVGGTHGNEYTGTWCIKAIQNNQYSIKQKYPSLTISTLLANPQAFLQNKRFVDNDLNREFTSDKLSRNLSSYASDNRDLEAHRAQEINAILGPKSDDLENTKTDVVIDLHTTTANMGITLIIPEGDSLMAQAAAYVIAKCEEERSIIENNANDGDKEMNIPSKCQCIVHSIPEKKKRPFLSSIGKHGFTIEVGPVPQGLLRHDMVENTQRALHYLLEFLQRKNKDEALVLKELEKFYPDGKVPCFSSAPAKKSGEISGKITWPCDAENPNFPSVLVHKDVQDNDFHIIRKGDPLFVRLDGSTINYNGSHGDEVYLMFINEGGYYFKSSGTGISVTVASHFSIVDGLLHKEDATQI